MKNNSFKVLCLLFFISIIQIACSQTDVDDTLKCNESNEIVYAYTNPDGIKVRFYSDGTAYIVTDGNCEYFSQIFNPNFFVENYVENAEGIFLRVGSGLFEPFRSFAHDFEKVSTLNDLFITSVEQRDRLFTTFTMQSPAAPTVNEYVALKNCILNNTCDFIDNRFDIATDPEDSENQVLKFYAVAPTENMVTSKSSISTTLNFFRQGDDFWYEARYYVQGENPNTIADFESSNFEGGPGPRIVMFGNRLAVENKFGDKITYRQSSGSEISFPKNTWVTVKIHLRFHVTDGIIQLWQDDQLIVDATGRTIPVDFWINDRLEIGISATGQESTLFVDDVRFSDSPF